MTENNLVFGKRESSFIKGILITLMVIHHLFGVATSPVYVDSALWVPVASFGKICVSAYAFLSGYGLCVSSKGFDIKTIVKRIFNLLVRYWICLIIIVLMDIMSGAMTVNMSELAQVAASFFCVYFKYDANAWFILPYICFVVLLPGLMWFVEKIKNKYIQIVVEVLCIVVPLGIAAASYIQLGEINYIYNTLMYTVLFMVPFFYIGAFFAKYRLFEKVRLSQSSLINIFLGTLFLVVAIITRRYCHYGIYGNNIADIVISPVFIISLLLIMRGIKVEWLFRMFCKLGSMSTNIWLIHYVFCQGSLKFLVEFSDFGIVAIGSAFVLCVLSSVVIDQIYNVVMKQKRVLCRRK